MLKKISNRLLEYRVWLWLALLLMASLYCAVHFPFRGEEGQYTVPVIEMSYHHFYWAPLSFGTYYWRPPMFNWLIILLTNLVGLQHVLGAARVVAITASIGMGLTLWWFAFELFENKKFAVLSVLVLFTGDLLFRHSWIAYADPLFSFFVFGAIAFMWVGSVKNKTILLVPAVLFLIAGFLTKAFTIYLFYSTAALILLLRHHARWSYFLNTKSILLHLFSITVPALWLIYTPHSKGHAMLIDLARPFLHIGITAYLLKPITYPLRLLARTAPLSFVALFYFFKNKNTLPKPLSVLQNTSYIKTIFWVLLISLLPYWLAAPKATHIRYIIPLYPLMAILFAYTFWQAGEKALKLTVWIVVFSLIAKILTSFWGLPWFEKMTTQLPNIADNIIQTSRGYPLYNDDTAGTGLSVSSIIDLKRLPQPPLVTPPEHWNNGFVIAFSNNPKLGKFYARYYTGRKHYLYLLCRGKACTQPKGNH